MTRLGLRRSGCTSATFRYQAAPLAIFRACPIPQDWGIWIRASRLAERCNLCVHVNALPPGWRVRVELMTDLSVYSEGTGEHLLEAFAAAINRAESMGMVRGKPRGT